MKVLIIQTAFIGDVILATPLFREIQVLIPGIELDVLVRKGNESLLENFPGISKILIWEKKQRKFQNLTGLLQKIRSSNYDVVINLQRFASTGFLTAFSGAKHRIGFSKNPLSFFFTDKVAHQIGGKTIIHETERNLTLLHQFGQTANNRPVLYPSPADVAFVSAYKQSEYFCIAPTSVWFTKQVPAEKWLELIQSLRQSSPSSPIYLLGGPADFPSCEKIKNTSGDAGITNLSGKLSFLQTAALMKDARMNFVNDSAPMHIASAMNAPVTAFFCSTVPRFGFGPLSDSQAIVEVDDLSCRPCGLHGYTKCPQGHFHCALKLNMNVRIPQR